MVSAETRVVIDKAKQIYAERLRDTLEAEYWGQFVAIEPESGDHFLADTFDGAVFAARDKYPDRLTYTIRVGHAAAVDLSGYIQIVRPFSRSV